MFLMSGELDSKGITLLLHDWQGGGNLAALDALTPIVYRELQQIAGRYMRQERPGHTLQPTALIHEAYIRLIDQNMPAFSNRTHFFAVSARIMRQVLVDSARAQKAAKRGAGQKAPLNDSLAIASEGGACDDVLALHEALDRLAAFDERKARIIEMRYFGGLNREEVAEAMGLTLATVKRDLTIAEAWLRRELGAAAANSAG
jgi:RNA polymerase sigma-70 factor (ECF subfamily)